MPPPNPRWRRSVDRYATSPRQPRPRIPQHPLLHARQELTANWFKVTAHCRSVPNRCLTRRSRVVALHRPRATRDTLEHSGGQSRIVRSVAGRLARTSDRGADSPSLALQGNELSAGSRLVALRERHAHRKLRLTNPKHLRTAQEHRDGSPGGSLTDATSHAGVRKGPASSPRALSTRTRGWSPEELEPARIVGEVVAALMEVIDQSRTSPCSCSSLPTFAFGPHLGVRLHPAGARQQRGGLLSQTETLKSVEGLSDPPRSGAAEAEHQRVSRVRSATRRSSLDRGHSDVQPAVRH
jgi:hypothetical protein